MAVYSRAGELKRCTHQQEMREGKGGCASKERNSEIFCRSAKYEKATACKINENAGACFAYIDTQPETQHSDHTLQRMHKHPCTGTTWVLTWTLKNESPLSGNTKQHVHGDSTKWKK